MNLLFSTLTLAFSEYIVLDAYAVLFVKMQSETEALQFTINIDPLRYVALLDVKLVFSTVRFVLLEYNTPPSFAILFVNWLFSTVTFAFSEQIAPPSLAALFVKLLFLTVTSAFLKYIAPPGGE